MGVPFQQSLCLKQRRSNFQDRESSSTQSTDESYSEFLTIGSDIQPPHKDGNANNTKLVDGQVESAVSMVSQDSIFSAQMDYKQPLVCIPFSNAEPYIGGFMAPYGPHTMIPHMGFANSRVPLPFDPFRDEPMYVNPKQYHGILRRRQQRAKLEAQNKLAKDRKPYLHESRHLHAVRRARGSGGRFVSAKKQLQESKPNRGGSCTTSSSDASNGGEFIFPNPNFGFSNYSSYVGGNQKWSL